MKKSKTNNSAFNDMYKSYSEANKKALKEDQKEYEGSFRQFIDKSLVAIFKEN